MPDRRETLKPLLSSTNPPYILLTVPCGKPECRNIVPAQWLVYLRLAVAEIAQNLCATATAYVNLGIRFHNVPMAVRAKMARSDGGYAPVYQQFGSIETRTWSEDPFFEPVRRNCKILPEVVEWMENEDNPELVGLTEISEKINICRALIEGMKTSEGDLRVGVETLERVAAEGRFRQARTWTRKRTGRCLSSTAMRRYTYEWSAYRNWERRIDWLVSSFCGSIAEVKETQILYRPEI